MSSSELRNLVAEGVTFMEVLDRVRKRSSGPLTAIEFMKVLQEELGIYFTETREMYEYFDSDLCPTVDVHLINERGRLLLERRV